MFSAAACFTLNDPFDLRNILTYVVEVELLLFAEIPALPIPDIGAGKPDTSSTELAVPDGIEMLPVTTTIFPAFIYVQVPDMPALVFTVAV